MIAKNLNDLAVFVRVLETRSLTRAGKELGISTSAVSKHISRLEHAVGLKLVARTTHGVSVTEAGHIYGDRCAKLLAGLAEAQVEAAAVNHEIKGVLKVHSTPGVGLNLVAPATLEFSRRYSAITVELTISEVSANVIRRGVDVVIASRSFKDDRELQSNLICRNLGETRYVVCASPRYFAEHGTPAHPSELSNHDCLIHLTQKRRPDHWDFMIDEERTRVAVRGVYRSNLESAVLLATLDGLGIARLPEYTVFSETERGQLRSIFAKQVTSDRTVRAFYPKSRVVPEKVKAFVSLVAARHTSRVLAD